MQIFIEKYFRVYSFLEKNKFLSAIKRSFVMLVPVFMIGAFALLIANFPITPVREFINTVFEGKLGQLLVGIFNATFGFSAVYLVLAIGFHYSKAFTKDEVVRLFCCINSLVCYFVFLGPVVFSPGEYSLINYTNMSNVFSALLISLLSVKFFFALHDLFIKLLNKTKKISNDLSKGLYSIFSIVISALFFGIMAVLIALIPDVSNFNDLIVYILSRPFQKLGATFGGGILMLFFQSVLWLFGIHGSNVFETISQTIFAYNEANIVSKNFMDCYVLLGGCGSSMCLLIAILIFSRNKEKRKISYSASGPMLFNVNEIMVFGLPIVLNPVYIIPFILTPIVCFMVSYFFVSIGAVPMISNPSVQWTTPILLSGYQATGSVAASILQLLNICIGVAIYTPFVKLDDFFTKKISGLITDELSNYVRKCEDERKPTNILSIDSYMSVMGEAILSKLEDDIENENITLFYQPQYRNGHIISLEGLLRFSYLEEKYLYPPLLISLSIERNLFARLSKLIVRQAIIDTRVFLENDPNVKVAINLRFELLLDEEFMNWFNKTVEDANLPANSFGIEFTEESNIPNSVDLSPYFNDMHQKHLNVLLDDFSMGYTSITYLQKNHFDYVKLDGRLIDDIHNERSRNIIASIIRLGKDLGFEVIAEYVETIEQRDILMKMGCTIFQGYLFSKPIPRDQMAIMLRLYAKETVKK